MCGDRSCSDQLQNHLHRWTTFSRILALDTGTALFLPKGTNHRPAAARLLVGIGGGAGRCDQQRPITPPTIGRARLLLSAHVFRYFGCTPRVSSFAWLFI